MSDGSAQRAPVETTLPWRERVFPNQEWALILVLLLECVVFSITGNNFFSRANGFEITRLSVEIGLLALALTPVIISGGIDLSVGAVMGLTAVVLGSLWRDAGLPLPLAAPCALLVGLAGGGLNAALITRLGLPPLIVTLGTLSLFRGIAEGFTRAIENYSGFPPGFLFLGQGYVAGFLPTQLVILVIAAMVAGWVLHRSAYGRSVYAIGFSPEGARHAGIPVSRRLAAIYVSSGVVSSLAAIIYVAHLGQAKSDAGTGYGLTAITAVVLGGASIFGGRGTVLGTLLGLFGIVILQNGLRLSAAPTELAGILTGVLLVGTILLDRLSRRARAPARADLTGEGSPVKNSQVGVLSAVILASGLIVAGSNWLLVSSIRDELRPSTLSAVFTDTAGERPVIAMMPKAKGDPYFISARQGAEEAADTLKAEGLEVSGARVDVTSRTEVEAAVGEAAETYGRLDILVNNAAANRWIPYPDLEALSSEVWGELLSRNLTSPFMLVRTLAPLLRRRGQGRIVNISSIAGFAPTGSSIAYAVSKAGLNHLTRCLAVALAPAILVNGVAPGLMEGTRMTDA
ncbi:MAG: SDR family NAD(P)-dependent oxidoreductase, partial [Gemmatimonadetes bacterium]|nr:SDR family NAD(P)-dependent oxidoreductase [Gemmatimonadota bacterium]